MQQDLRHDALERLEWKKILASLASCAVFDASQERLAALEPTLAPDERTHVFRATAEARLVESEGRALPLSPIAFETFQGALARGAIISVMGLWNLRLLLMLCDAATVFVRKEMQASRSTPTSVPILLDLLSSVTGEPKLLARLAQSVDAEGNLLSTASPELRAARGKLEVARRRMVEALETLLRKSSIRDALQDTVWMQREGRYVLPVRTDRKGDVPGVPRGVSGSGSTVFVEPTELGHVQNQIEIAETDVQVEEARVMRELSELAFTVKDGILASLGALEIYDTLRARARFAMLVDGVEPRFHADRAQGAFAFHRARHPLFVLENKPCIPNDLVLQANVWVLSGPNAGGKTVAMKTAGTIVLMALAGLYVPALEASLYAYQDVYVEMGDRQNLSDDLSTFSGHLVHIKAILDSASDRTLILLDEGFVGTDPTVGVAMARAALESLADARATVVITTHFSGLKTLADGDPRFANGSMEFEPRQLKPTYRLQNGVPGLSYALELGARLGLSEDLLDRARRYSGEEMMRVERLVQELSRQKDAVEKLREEQEEVTAALKVQLDAIERDRVSLTALRESLVEGYRARLQKRLNAFENRLEIRERQFDRTKRDFLSALEDRAAAQALEAEAEAAAASGSSAGFTAPGQPTAAPGTRSETRPKPNTGARNAAPATGQSGVQTSASGGAKEARATLTGFDALRNFSFNATAAAPGAGRDATQADLDARAARARRPDRMTPRDLLDEARESLDVLGRSFDAIQDSFSDDIDTLAEESDVLTGSRSEKAKKAKAALKAAEAAKAPRERHPPHFWKPGMKVRTQRFREQGEVLRNADSKKLVECKFGLVKVKVPHNELFTPEEISKGLHIPDAPARADSLSFAAATPQPTPASKPRVTPVSVTRTPTANPDGQARNTRDMAIEPTFQHKGNTLDLRGQLVDTALERLEDFLDRAWQHEQNTIIVIHGHGTGRVKQAVREFLQGTSYELTWRPGTSGEGSDGVTVVKLK